MLISVLRCRFPLSPTKNRNGTLLFCAQTVWINRKPFTESANVVGNRVESGWVTHVAQRARD